MGLCTDVPPGGDAQNVVVWAKVCTDKAEAFKAANPEAVKAWKAQHPDAAKELNLLQLFGAPSDNQGCANTPPQNPDDVLTWVQQCPNRAQAFMETHPDVVRKFAMENPAVARRVTMIFPTCFTLGL